MDTLRKPLTAFLATLLSSAFATGAQANSPPFIAPFTDQTLQIGETLHLRVIPSDKDQSVPALNLSNPPAGSHFEDNLDGTRTFHWTPATDDVGVHYFRFVATDSEDASLFHTRQLKVRIVDEEGSTGNQAPLLMPLADHQVVLGDVIDFRVEALDPDGTVPALTVQPLPQGARFLDNLDGSRQFLWTPTLLSPGSVNLTFTATDADESIFVDTQSVTLRVTNADGAVLPGEWGNASHPPGVENNRAPIIPPIDPPSVALGQSFDFSIRALDLDGDVPELALIPLPDGASFSDKHDGSYRFQWTPEPENLGATSIRIEAIDARDSTLRTRLVLPLMVFRDAGNPVNFPPSINGFQDPLVRIGDTLNLRVVAVDPDHTVPALQVTDAPAKARFIDNGDGSRTLIWPTDVDDAGTTSVTFVATDAQLTGTQVSSTTQISVVSPESLNRPGERLRILAEPRGLSIGFAAPLHATGLPDNELYLQLAAEEFNLVTPQHSFMMDWIHPQRDIYRFSDADALADYAQSHAMQLHGQTLISHDQLPAWILEMDPAELEEAMSEHIDALAGRYRSRTAIWNVVGKALDEQGRLRHSVWTQAMGADYIAKAFRATRAVDPDAQLIYNEVDVITENAKSDALYALLKRELLAGTPIDGVGFQGHLSSNFTEFSSVEKNLQRFADLGLDIYITEFEVALVDDHSLQTQADVYRRFMQLCLRQNSCKSIQAWGYTDRYSFTDNSQSLLLTPRYQAKPAYEAWQNTLRDFER